MTEQISPPTIREMLRTLNSAADDDTDFVVACAFNLYFESMKRVHNRVLMSPADVKSLFSMIDMLLTERQHGEYKPAPRSEKLSEEEEQKLLNVIQETPRRI